MIVKFYYEHFHEINGPYDTKEECIKSIKDNMGEKISGKVIVKIIKHIELEEEIEI